MNSYLTFMLDDIIKAISIDGLEKRSVHHISNQTENVPEEFCSKSFHRK